MTTKTVTEAAAAEKQAVTKRSWPLWKKLTIAGVTLTVIIALSVGLGVGLTRGKASHDDEPEPELKRSVTTRASLWKPKVGTPWQIVLRQPIKLDDNGEAEGLKPDVAIYDLDMYDNDAETFAALHDAGRRVICYFSAGSWENWRTDKNEFKKQDMGKTLDGWPDEKWLNLSSPSVRNIMKKRIKLAAQKGCDAIDPDNVDGYQNDNGLGLTQADSISYVKFLSAEAAKYNMSTGLKNAGDIIESVLPYVAFSVNEQCVNYEECETFAAFIKAGKPVFNIEYPKGAPKVKDTDRKTICSQKGKAAGTKGFSIVIKNLNLDGWVMYCTGKKYETVLES
ncbi:hypothetical protein FZEAL_4036 [Fusarium zealandicum]|uniref:alpha-galactosidase n=1 Tax=Fusarium zealandicum TaxID=1053134 RepID=A0A8H4UMF3_9HYPO|nr:hypothetical protein FZEAL_4036 [Fusarium zealandicum]